MWGWDHMNGYGGWGFGWIFMILFWVLIIVAIVALVRWLSVGIAGGSRDKSALRILEERYARGEIGEDEFRRKKKDLSS